MKILNALSMKPFGVILDGAQDNAALLSATEVETADIAYAEANDMFCCYYDSPIVMHVIDGIPQITFLTDGRLDMMNVFLLDRPIMIKRNIYFRIKSLQGQCTVRITCERGAQYEKLRFLLEGDRTVLRDQLYINNIYTLFYQEKGKDFHFKGERHNFWELTYIDYGCMQTIVDGQEYLLNQGEAILYGPGQYHIQRSAEGMFINFITITFDLSMPNSESLTNRVFSIGNEQAEILKSILIEHRLAQRFYETSIINELKRFIIGLIRMEILDQHVNMLSTTKKNYTEDHVVGKALEYIHNNIGRNIKMDDIAHHVNLSKPYLSIVFKRHKAQTPIEYLIDIRLTRGKQLIREGKLNITEIAETLGYSSIHYFSNQFKKRFGVSPSAYSRSIDQ